MLSRSRWPHSLRVRCESTAACLLGLQVLIPPREYMPVSQEYCVLSGKALCDGLNTRPEKCHRVWCVWQWSSSLDNEKVKAHYALSSQEKNNYDQAITIIWSQYIKHFEIFLYSVSPQRQIFHYKSQMDWPESEHGLQRSGAGVKPPERMYLLL
jgi:hypothetical protein